MAAEKSLLKGKEWLSEGADRVVRERWQEGGGGRARCVLTWAMCDLTSFLGLRERKALTGEQGCHLHPVEAEPGLAGSNSSETSWRSD